MKGKINSPSDYLRTIPDDKRDAFSELRNVIKKNLPPGFDETIIYGMIGFVVPHSIYPGGYHCDPKLPLPFISIACQKNHIALHHLGLFADKALFEWFRSGYPKSSTLDAGKGCVRFKVPDEIPFKLIGKLAKKLTVKKWIKLYESAFKR